ncbi:MAG: hypothetical protein SGI90_00695 [Candidatus Eisenbacteria bacterium]|nr:hypothetical protein [Candidatus Eisenbacteria bacterium]
MTSRHATPWPGLLILLVLGGLIAFLTARMAADRPMFQEPAGGEYQYVAAARNLDSPRMIEPPVSTTAPAYPHLLAQFGDLTSGIAGARQMQWILLGALLPFLSGLAAARHFGARAGLVAGGLVMLTGGFWVSAGTLVPHAWQAVGALILLLLTPRFTRQNESPEDRPAPLLAAVIGMGIVLAITRLFGAAWAPALAVVLLVVLLVRREFIPGIALVAAFGIALALGGAARLDKTAGAAPLLFGGGVDAVLGWHDGATGVDPRRGESAPWRWTTAREIAIETEKTEKRSLNIPELSRKSYAHASAWAVRHPAASLELVLRKYWLVLSGAELAAPESARFRAEQTVPWARWLLPVSILVMVLGMAGLAGQSGPNGVGTLKRPGRPRSMA